MSQLVQVKRLRRASPSTRDPFPIHLIVLEGVSTSLYSSKLLSFWSSQQHRKPEDSCEQKYQLKKCLSINSKTDKTNV
ncbi:hypothetical protein O181_048667 [Austropuccinia psidii MF-1]|uniref:Uncharacterized protein n=1 Tax=Austropuccinia psidii MF-1 TaxID=1389203 RepID=A0A9Q3E0B1_9BASI|nr:hypothetical protein [Austropuccinia psidii MF-1]